MMTRRAVDGRLSFVAALALAFALPGCASTENGAEVEEPQEVTDESVEEATAGGPVRHGSGTVTGTAHAVGGGYLFVGASELDSGCDATGHVKRIRLPGNARSEGEEFMSFTGAPVDLEVAGDQLYYSVITGCGLAGGYLARRPLAGGEETVLMRVGADVNGESLNRVGDIVVRGDAVYAIVYNAGRTTIRKVPTNGGAWTEVADFSRLPNYDDTSFTNLQVDESAAFVREENHSALYRIPLTFRGNVTEAQRFPAGVTTPIGDFAIGNGKVYFVSGDRRDRIMAANANGNGAAATIVWPGAGVRTISELSSDATNVYFFGEFDRAIYRYDIAGRRVVRVARSLTVDTQPVESNLSTDGANLYWLQLNNRADREQGSSPYSLAKSWLPRG